MERAIITGDDAAGAELDGFLDDELELVALGQALQENELAVELARAVAAFDDAGGEAVFLDVGDAADVLAAAAVGEDEFFSFTQTQHEEMLPVFAAECEWGGEGLLRKRRW